MLSAAICLIDKRLDKFAIIRIIFKNGFGMLWLAL